MCLTSFHAVLNSACVDRTVSQPLLHQTETESRAETHGTGVRHNTKYNGFLLMQYRIRDLCIWYKQKRHLRFLCLLKGYYHSTYYKNYAPSVKPINQITKRIVKKKKRKINQQKLLMATFNFFIFFVPYWY